MLERMWLVVEAARRVTNDWACSRAWDSPGDETSSALCDAVALLDGREPEDEEKMRAFLGA